MFKLLMGTLMTLLYLLMLIASSTAMNEKPIGEPYVTLDEIWEVLQIVENRLPQPLHGFTITVYDPCIEDQICMAKREVKRLEREKEENEKIKKLIEKFRKGLGK